MTTKADAIKRLLNICAENNISIPPDLKDCLISGGDGIEFKAQHEEDTESILSSEIKRADSLNRHFDESEVMKEIREMVSGINPTPMQWELRLKNAGLAISSTVMPQVSDDLAFAEGGVPIGEQSPDGEDVESNHLDQDKKAERKSPPKEKPPTIMSSGMVSKVKERVQYFRATGKVVCGGVEKKKDILKGVNLRFESGKMYLLLGAPGAGKSSLLKYIANLHEQQSKNNICSGEMTINGVSPSDKPYYWSNLVGYVDQIDRHHEYLTVKETMDYAFQCRRAGSHNAVSMGEPSQISEEIKAKISEHDRDERLVHLVMKALGLTRVADTFVGDDERVRGVSGGERKRVTVAEMTVGGTPILCLDEISTGLDAATTYDICQSFGHACRMTSGISIISLLQPPPETVALFDELIFINEGQVLYSGPLTEAVPYFERLGYVMPERVDMADWLLSLVTKDGAAFMADPLDDHCPPAKHMTQDDFVRIYKESETNKLILTANDVDSKVGNIPQMPLVVRRYANSWLKSLKIVLSHEFLLWRRDQLRLRARLVQGCIMGAVVGTVFFQQADNPTSGLGVIYQSLFFISLGGLSKVMPQIDSRGVFYKHQDANFFPTSAFVIGRSLAMVPSSLLDALLYGVPVFFLSGMAYSDGATIANFFMFLLITLVSAYTTLMAYTILSATVENKASAMAKGSIILLFMVVFSGFTVQPDVIPPYWIWVYWCNYFAWLLRAMVLNQYLSGKFDEVVDEDTGTTHGEAIIREFGFVAPDGTTYGYEWVWWGILFSLCTCAIASIANVVCLNRVRFATGQTLQSVTEDDEIDENQGASAAEKDGNDLKLSFQKANLTFEGIRYTVKSSISKEQIELLKGIDGYFAAGKLTALMGSSGAGKTTLMDVLALRKTGGKIDGVVKVNGHLQNAKSFRRCTGYVEQFDVQSEQLTVRETVEFSARMRIDRKQCDGMVVDEATIQSFVDQTMAMLELGNIEHFLVGSDSGGGLSFEQKKRLSIAVELASNPSILFLDEPTSGLDARSAAVVMRGLKRIAETGRAVCATIHQPSVAIFNSFDMLLLLKRGGEVVFSGELGEESANLIEYFERFDEAPRIRPGENPATWMLTTIGSGTTSQNSVDYARAYATSELRATNLETIRNFNASSDEDSKIVFDNVYATSMRYQMLHVFKRQFKVYWRSPSYNRSRIMISAIIGLLFGSVFASQRVPRDAGDMNSRVTSLYVSTLFVGAIVFQTVIPFFERERNMYYRHKASLMYNQFSVTLAFLVSEAPFVLLQSLVFSVCFYFPLGFATGDGKFGWFYFFVSANIALWCFLGQMLVALMSDAVTALGFGSILLGMSSLFAGVLIAPQFIQPFWEWAYWLFPMHYVIEGLVVSQYHDDNTLISTTLGGEFYDHLVSSNSCEPCGGTCCGEISEWLDFRFGGEWNYGHLKWNALYLVMAIMMAQAVKLLALWRLNFLAK